MNNSTISAIWPISQPSSEVKQLVDRFFSLVDTNSQEVGQTLADEIFNQDGVFITANATFQGAAGKIAYCLVYYVALILLLIIRLRNIAIQKGRMGYCENSKAYNFEKLCERRAWHRYLPCRKTGDGGIGWNKDKPGVCSSDKNRRTRVGAQNKPIPNCQSSSPRFSAYRGSSVSSRPIHKYPL